MNRNYPKLMNNFTTCLLCNNDDETNIHIWNCPAFFATIKDCFRTLAGSLSLLLKKEGDKLTITVDDTIKYSPTFRWALTDRESNHNIPLHAILLLQSYVTVSQTAYINTFNTFAFISLPVL